MVHRSLATATKILGAILFFLPSVAFADSSLAITKVVADVPGPNAGHQYIEVSNTGTDSIDLGAKTIRLVDHSGKHLIKSYSGSETTLEPGSSVVIAQNPDTYLADNPSYSGAVLKSSFSLTETGTVQIVETGTSAAVLATKSYASAPTAKKPIVVKPSSTKQQKHYSSKNSYGTSIKAPLASADTGVSGAPSGSAYALPVPPGIVAFIDDLAANAWFALFLGLLAFSAFSIIVIQNQECSRV